MPWWVGTIIGVYVVGALFAFLININIGPVTPGLALMRALLWPLWLAGFIPGQRLPMD